MFSINNRKTKKMAIFSYISPQLDAAEKKFAFFDTWPGFLTACAMVNWPSGPTDHLLSMTHNTKKDKNNFYSIFDISKLIVVLVSIIQKTTINLGSMTKAHYGKAHYGKSVSVSVSVSVSSWGHVRVVLCLEHQQRQ